MNSFLSRLRLDPWHPQTRCEFDQPYQLHRTLSRGFPDLAAERLLFRAERDKKGQAMVVVQSRTAPDWEGAKPHMPHLRDINVKTITLEGIISGQSLRFCLVCRPSRRLAGHREVREDGKAKRGPRIILKTPDEIFGWIRCQGERNGFEVAEAVFDRVYWVDTFRKDHTMAPGIDKEKTPVPSRMRIGDESLLGAVRFEGELIVVDPDKLRRAVANGIGTQKAYGFGLLSLARGRNLH